MQTIDVAERRARLAVRHRLAPDARADDPESATAAMVCLHATDPASVYLSAWARVRDFSVVDLERAFYVDRTLVKHLAMRRTLFVFPRTSLEVVQSAASNRVADGERRRLARDVEKAGLHADGAAWLEEASRTVMETLVDGREATSTELRDEIPLLRGAITYGQGRTWGGEVPVAPRVLTTLSAGGRLVRASNQGGWSVSRPRWTAMAAWLGNGLEPLDEAQAAAALVRDWLLTFGPGTAQDLKWWLGSTVATVRRALSAVEAVEVDLEGQTGFVLPDDLGFTAAAEPWAALLPALDPTTMGWFERDWYLGPHRAELFDRNGNGGATAWWDGRIVGGWRQTSSGEVVVDLLEDVDAGARRALTEEAGRLTDWLSGVLVRPRFPSPSSKRAT